MHQAPAASGPIPLSRKPSDRFCKDARWPIRMPCACNSWMDRARTPISPRFIAPWKSLSTTLVARALGVPLSETVGGRVRDRIRLYGSAGMYMPPERYAEEAAAIADLGFRAYKMRPGLGPEQDLETVRRMRKAVGPDFDLMVDAHTWWRMGDRSYDFSTVERLAKEMAAYRVAWLEEPLAAGRSRVLPPLEASRSFAARQRRA